MTRAVSCAVFVLAVAAGLVLVLARRPQGPVPAAGPAPALVKPQEEPPAKSPKPAEPAQGPAAPPKSHSLLGDAEDAVLAETETLRRSPGEPVTAVIRKLLQAQTTEAKPVTIDYPANESVFPPEIVAPTFLWHDAADKADTWLVDVAGANGAEHVYALAAGKPAPPGRIDARCKSDTNEVYQPTPYQASGRSWTPDQDVWDWIKRQSSGQPATVTISGFSAPNPSEVLSRGQMALTTSKDPVGATIFYRDVPLAPGETEKGTIKPLPNGALPLIVWRLRDISRPESRILLENMPTCANCHSFSADGRTLGMDIDGPSGDKGAYAIAPVSKNMTISDDKIITWNSFKGKPEGHKTIGFMSQISPDGQYAVTTLNDSVYVANFLNYKFIQVFYPTRGILGYYSMRTGEMKALPGASDPEYVHSNPAWYPDGKTLVFVRAKAKDAYVDGRALASYPNDPLETPVQYDLYRMPFNDGQGGKAEPVKGASDNGMSNNFPKVSPDGKWIVFVKCKNGLLMRPDSRLWIVPFEGGEAREMRCNLSLMNSWHSFSPNGRWLVFASKANTPYTQMFLTHIDEQGNDSPAILVPNSTAANRAVNIPEFVAVRAEELLSIKAPAVDYYRHVERGDTFSEKRRLEEAAAEYRKALQSEPESSRIHFKLGSVLLEVARGQWAGGDRETAERGRDEAAAHLRKAIEIDPRNAKSHIVLGLIHTTRNESEEAAKCFRRAIESDPLNVAGYDYLGEILLDQKKLPEAIEYFKRAVDIVPDVKMNCFLARLLVQDGRHGQAIEYLKKAVEADPRHPGARLELGDLLVSEGKPEEAGGHFLEALRIDPRNAQAHDRLGAVLLKQGKTIEAIRHFKEALAINPGYSPARANLEAATRALRE